MPGELNGVLSAASGLRLKHLDKAVAAARKALEPLIENRLTQRVCTLMARIEGEEGNTGGVREWLARAVNAPRDPAWTADGVVSDEWAPVSPVTGALDAFQWRVPVEAAEPRDSELLAQKIEELVALGAANIAAGVSGGFPVTGGFSRSVVNFDAGAETPAAAFGEGYAQQNIR